MRIRINRTILVGDQPASMTIESEDFDGSAVEEFSQLSDAFDEIDQYSKERTKYLANLRAKAIHDDDNNPDSIGNIETVEAEIAEHEEKWGISKPAKKTRAAKKTK